MAGRKPSPRRIKKDERKPPPDSRDQEQAIPPFLNEGLELVRDSHC